MAAIMQGDGSPAATRATSTVGLSPDEITVYDLQGRFRGFIGTPIHDNFFLTAQHIGISPSDTISFDQGPNTGVYTIRSWHDDPDSDLRVVEIDGSFPAVALVNAAADETGEEATIFGRGGAPNGSVSVDTALKGWTAASPDGEISWGRNEVTGTFGLDQIYARFDRNGVVGEGGVSTGDSGGGWFLRDSLGVLRLAAVTFAVTGPFQQDQGGVPDGNPFNAALFDIGGLWVGEAGAESFVPENPVDVPGVAFATRTSARINWIETIVPIVVADSDSDGVPDSQDNCPFVANADQLDNGGLGFSTTPDGIGNACQCGDVTGEGQVNETDANFIKRWALGLSAPLFLVPGNCDVTGEGDCTGSDGSAIRLAFAGVPNSLYGQACANAMP